MKKFFQEYGMLALAAIVIVMLVGMASPVGTEVKERVLSLSTSLGGKTKNTVETAMRPNADFIAGGGTENVPTIEYLSLGGEVFLDNGDNGATYTFYDADKNEITYSNLDSLNNAVYYSVEGTPSADRFYVVAADSNQADYNSTHKINIGKDKTWGYIDKVSGSYYGPSLGCATGNDIGSGKTNTSNVLAIADKPAYYNGSMWEWINKVNSQQYGGQSDWFIGSQAELEALDSHRNNDLLWEICVWSSYEDKDDGSVYTNTSDFGGFKEDTYDVIAFRAF